jgi:hypothetical protein
MSTAVQIKGFTTANILEVERRWRAARVTYRPPNWGSLGMYAMGAASGVMAAGLAGASPIYGFRYTGANLCLVRSVSLVAIGNTTAFAAGVATFNLSACRSFSISYSTGGTAITLTGDNGNLRTSMAATGVGSIYVASTGIIGGATLTRDSQALAVRTTGVTAAAALILSSGNPPLFENGCNRLICANNEGFDIRATVPATGTWNFAVNTVWEELTAF